MYNLNLVEGVARIYEKAKKQSSNLKSSSGTQLRKVNNRVSNGDLICYWTTLNLAAIVAPQ